MKVIFLDVDGELTYANYKNKETENIDIEKVKLLKKLCDETNAKIVVSSSWRGYDENEPYLYKVLINILTENGIEVIGKTPYIPSEIEGDVPEMIKLTTLEDLPDFVVKHGTGRAAEVEKWIKEHNVDQFVILDDENWEWDKYGMDKNWIQPTWFGDGGLKEEHIEKAIQILNKKG